MVTNPSDAPGAPQLQNLNLTSLSSSYILGGSTIGAGDQGLGGSWARRVPAPPGRVIT